MASFPDGTPKPGTWDHLDPFVEAVSLSPPTRQENLIAVEGLHPARAILAARLRAHFEAVGFEVQGLGILDSSVIRHAFPEAQRTLSNPLSTNLLLWMSLYEQTMSVADSHIFRGPIIFDGYRHTARLCGASQGVDGDVLTELARGLTIPAVTILVTGDRERRGQSDTAVEIGAIQGQEADARQGPDCMHVHGSLPSAEISRAIDFVSQCLES